MKRKLMFLVAIMALVSTASFGQLKYGGGVSFGTKSGGINDSGEEKFGIGINARVDYTINEKFSVAPNFTYWIASAPAGIDLTYWQLNGDVHYTFSGDEAMSFYGLAGLNYSYAKVNSVDDNEIGLNLGAGAKKNKLFGEVKYDTAYEQLALTVGILF